MSDFENLSGNDKELQEFLMIEKQKALVNAQVCERRGLHQLLQIHNDYNYDMIMITNVNFQVCLSLSPNRYTSSMRFAGRNASVNPAPNSTMPQRRA